MFCLFQLMKNKLITILFLLTAAFFMPLSGAVFAPEWDLDSTVKDKGSIRRIVERYPQGDVVHVFDRGKGKILRTFPEEKSRRKVECRMFYRKDGRLEKVATFIDGKLICTENGIYDDAGVLRGIRRVDAQNKDMISTTMLVYDEKSGRLKMYGIQTPQGVVDYYNEYDKKGNLVFVKGYFRNKFNAGARYVHDSNGLIKEVFRLNSRMQNAGILKNEYLLDGNGNWIEKKSLFYKTLKQKPIFAETVTRKIEYFK